MLPKDRPAIGDQKIQKDYRWNDATEAVPEVMALATPVTLQWVPSEREFNPEQSFKFTAERGRYLLVSVRHGLRGFGGYQLTKDFAQVIAVPYFPDLLEIPSEGSLLPPSGEAQNPLVSVRHHSVVITVSRP